MKAAEDIHKYQCNICYKSFKTNHHLRDHVIIHSESPNYKCQKCNHLFVSPGTYRHHVRINHGYECTVCGNIFDTIKELKQHHANANHIPSSNFMFDALIDKNKGIKSGYKPNVDTKVARVKQTMQKPAQIKKDIVKKIVQRSKQTDGSSVKISKNLKFQCNMCGTSFNLARSLARHKASVHRDSFKYTCEFCEYQANRSDNYKNHMSRHSEASIKCSISSCKLIFFSKICLQMHIKKAHSDVDGFQNSSKIKQEKIENSAVENSAVKRIPARRQTIASTAKKKVVEKVDMPKDSNYSVRYECCECNIDFGSNNELWLHLLAKHFHQIQNNTKK